LISKYMKKCSKCKIEKERTEFYKDKSAGDGLKSWCKKCFATHIKKRKKETNYYASEEYKIYQRGYIKRPHVKYKRYLLGNKIRNVEFTLTLEDFIKIVDNPCHYCGKIVEGMGVDRKDNKNGYTLENSLPCCWMCNQMKSTLSYDEFIAQCNRISCTKMY
jgi:hypothetical protein